MPEAREIKPLLLKLSSPDSQARERASTEIFETGRELVREVATKWLADPELAQVLILDSSGFPETTVGVAVEPKTFDALLAANGSPRLAEVPPDQDAKEFELHFGHAVHLDILTTRDAKGGGAIAKYLQKFGEGIQQIEFLVRNVDQATEVLRKRFGFVPIYFATRAGADGTRVNFFLVPTPQGKKVLIELVEAGGGLDL